MRAPLSERPAWTLSEVADWLGISVRSLQRDAAENKIPGAFRIRGRVLVSIEKFAAAYELPSPLKDAAA